MSLLRIRIEPPPDSVARSSTGEAKPGDSYVERLLKLIPAEAIGIYLVGLQIVGAENIAGVAEWTLACAGFVLVFRAILSTDSPKFGQDDGAAPSGWFKRLRQEAQWPAVFIATVSFLVWAMALGHPISPWVSQGLDYCGNGTKLNVICPGADFGTLVLLLWTPIAAFLYKGERVGNRAPAESKDGKKKPDGGGTEPSPTVTAPAPPASRKVLDPDDRKKATTLDRSPYESIALLHAFASGQSTATQIGTGWMVTPRHLVTAGHVLKGTAKILGWLAYDADGDKWGAHFESKKLRVHPNFINNGDASFDVGVIHLDEAVPNAEVLPLITDTDPEPIDLRCAGYPLDKGGLTMFESRGEPKSFDKNLMFHDIDTDEGQSGSPIWFGMQRKVVGVHTGHGLPPEPDLNHSVRLTEEVLDWINQQVTQ